MSAVESLVCPHCGADLEIPDGVSFLRCNYCGSKLQLKETGSVRALALIEKGLGAIGDNTARTADGVSRIHDEMLRAKHAALEQWQSRMRPLNEKITRLEAEQSQLGQSVRSKKLAVGVWKLLIAISICAMGIAVYHGFHAAGIDTNLTDGPYLTQRKEEQRVAANLSRTIAIPAAAILGLGVLLLVGTRLSLVLHQQKIEKVQAELSLTVAEYEQWRLREPL